MRRKRLTENINELPSDLHFTIGRTILTEQPDIRKTSQLHELLIDSKNLNEKTISTLEDMIRQYHNSVRDTERRREELDKLCSSDDCD